MQRSLAVLTLFLGIVVTADSGRADLVLAFDPAATSVPQGTPLAIDVMVATDVGTLDVYGFTLSFDITRIDGAGELTFVDPQELGYRTAANDFVLGDDVSNDVSLVGAGETTWETIFTTASFGPVTLDTTAKLLARLQLTSTVLPVLGSGSTFQISLVSASYEGDLGSESFSTSNLSTVTVTPASVVPEPSTLFASLLGLAILAIWRTGQAYCDAKQVARPSRESR